ncbi:helix-turn-helix transcriptional regulator, partial [Streptomyces sp. NPDC055078]
RPADAVIHFRQAAAAYAAMPRPYAAILATEAAETCVLAAAGAAGASGDARAAGGGGAVEEGGAGGVAGHVSGQGAAPRTDPDPDPESVADPEPDPDPDPDAESVVGPEPDPESVAAAVESLADCVERLTALGASWDAARVRATLRAHRPSAEHRPRGRPSYGDQLSPREQEVVDLASAGLTNREIAATLHLSPRTVEQHVSRARRKLESQSREPLSRPRGRRAP